MPLSEYSEDDLANELAARRAASRRLLASQRERLAQHLSDTFDNFPDLAMLAGCNLAGEFGAALQCPRDYRIEIVTMYDPLEQE